MYNLLYIKEFKELINLRHLENKNLKDLRILRQDTTDLLDKINNQIFYLYKYPDKESTYTLKDWLEYKNYINFTLRNINSDIRYLNWKLKTIQNQLNYIPLG